MGRILSRLVKALSKRKPDQGPRHRISMRDGHNFLYVEGNHRLLIRGEMLTGDVNFVVYASDISNWCPPHEHEAVGPHEIETILRRLREYLDRERIRYEIE